MPTKIEDKTGELCQTIIDQPEMISIRKRIDNFLSDSKTRGQYETVMSKGQALQEKQAQSQPLESAEIADFERHRDALLNNSVARGFLDAQEELHEIQHSIQKAHFQNARTGPGPDGRGFRQWFVRPRLRLPSLKRLRSGVDPSEKTDCPAGQLVFYG